MLCKTLLSADFSEQLHYSLPAQGFTCAELSRAQLPVMLTSTLCRALAGAQPVGRRCLCLPPPALQMEVQK